MLTTLIIVAVLSAPPGTSVHCDCLQFIAPYRTVCTAHVDSGAWVEFVGTVDQPDPGGDDYIFAAGSGLLIGGPVVLTVDEHDPVIGDWLWSVTWSGAADFDVDGDIGTDADIESFFACIASSCPSADFDRDGDAATDADIETFFSILSGGSC